jgi:DNA-binding NarL/FixJ family response regulator
MREGLRQLLGLEPDIQIVGEAGDGQAAVELAGKLRPDVVLMDVGMPKVDGVEATRAIRRNHPDIRVIGLSMFEEKERAQALREAGAVGYLSKSGRSADLIAAVLACMDDLPHPEGHALK